jgi:hypothetical protein
MTTIAFDGRFCAADSKSVSGGRKVYGMVKKLLAKNGVVYATTGFWGFQDAWVKWYESGQDPEKTPKHGNSDNDIGCFLVFRDGKCFGFSHVIPYAVEYPAPVAFGSGADYAIGAMRFGATAGEACAIACEEDNGSGGPVQVIDLLQLQECAA